MTYETHHREKAVHVRHCERTESFTRPDDVICGWEKSEKRLEESHEKLDCKALFKLLAECRDSSLSDGK